MSDYRVLTSEHRQCLLLTAIDFQANWSFFHQHFENKMNVFWLQPWKIPLQIRECYQHFLIGNEQTQCSDLIQAVHESRFVNSSFVRHLHNFQSIIQFIWFTTESFICFYLQNAILLFRIEINWSLNIAFHAHFVHCLWCMQGASVSKDHFKVQNCTHSSLKCWTLSAPQSEKKETTAATETASI